MKESSKAFTLVELLAVIVILAVILVIAIPQVMNIIGDVRKAAFSSSAKLLAQEAEKKFVQNEVLGVNKDINCSSVSKLNDEDYEYCNITINNGVALVTLVGNGKFEGMKVLNGTKSDAKVVVDDGGELYTLDDVYRMVNDLTSELEIVKSEKEQLENELKEKNSILEEEITNLKNKTNSMSILDSYPVGSIYVGSTNTNPSTFFGGEWTLVDKRFKASNQSYTSTSSVNMFTPTSNLSEYTVNVISVGNTLRLRLDLTPAIEFNDTTYELGTLNLANLGVSNLINNSSQIPCPSDPGNGIAYININYKTGVLNVVDVVTKTSGGTMSAGKAFHCDITYTIRENIILDSAAGEFHFKRTA